MLSEEDKEELNFLSDDIIADPNFHIKNDDLSSYWDEAKKRMKQNIFYLNQTKILHERRKRSQNFQKLMLQNVYELQENNMLVLRLGVK